MDNKHAQGGFTPMPVSLKILIILALVGLPGSFAGIASAVLYGFPFWGATLYGPAAILAYAVEIILGNLLLIIATFKRYRWTWKYAIGYMAFSIINIFISAMDLPARVDMIVAAMPAVISGMKSFLLVYGFAALIVGATYDIVVIAVFYYRRKYFEY